MSAPPSHTHAGPSSVCSIFVHVGAGYHSQQKERAYLRLCERASRCAMDHLSDGGDAVNAVEIAVKVLEDSEITNAGFGSNLNIDGYVECDATVINHRGQSGAIGAVRHIRNPIQLASLVLKNSYNVESLGRVPPNLLVGNGAVDFATDHGISSVKNALLVSAAARRQWIKHNAALAEDESEGRNIPDPPNRCDEDLITDTVGAIAIDQVGNIAAASSSGGIGLKLKGRVGPAALVGVGTAVIPATPNDKSEKSVATVVSGTGEHLTTTMAAWTGAQRLHSSTQKTDAADFFEVTDDHQAIQSFVEIDFLQHPSIIYSQTKAQIGILAVKKTVDGVWLHWAHNATTFALGSMSSNDGNPQSVVSRNKDPAKVTTGGRRII